MGNWILSAFADEYCGDLAGQIRILQQLQIPNIELRFLDGKNVASLSAREALQVKQQLDDGGIQVSALGSPLGKIRLGEDFAAHTELAKQAFENANILDTRNIRVFSFYLPEGKDRTQCRGEVIDQLGTLLELAESRGLQLCHENEANIYGQDPEHCLDLMQAFDGRLKCVFDMGNFVLDGCSPWPEGYELLKHHIAYFHIKDSLAQGAVVPAGRGQANIRQILHAYRAEFQRDVLLTVEPHLQTFDGLNKLVGKTFENPYQFPTAQEAFLEGVRSTRALL